MKHQLSAEQAAQRIEELESRLEEAEELIAAIKAGEVDAFALTRDNESQIFTLESGDFAYRLLVENFSEGALTLSDDGLILYTNDYFHELLGVSYNAVIGKPVFQFIHCDSKEAFDQLFKKGLTGQSKGEINLYEGGKIIPVYISLTSLYPKLQTVGMIVTDLTEKKQQEEILQQQNKELEKMNKELQSFAYISSHDLQEPLRKIQIFVTRLIEQENQNFSERAKDMFGRMQSAARRMQTLIDDLLAYSRTNTVKRQFEQVDLYTIIEEIKDDLKEEIIEKRATIESIELCEANIIPFQFRQMMHNLIGNALKFSRPNIPPHIQISSKIEQGLNLNGEKLLPQNTYCHVSIADNGIGFEQEYSEKIFELFQRLHDKLEYDGTGIGLAIVKKIVDNHQGIITAKSELNKGARFDIYIPAN